jgi:hypothetical protein
MRIRNQDRVINKFVQDPSCLLALDLTKKDGAAFRSDDQYGSKFQKVGAVWSPQGIYFDGVDDGLLLQHSSPVFSIGYSALTILAWVKYNSFPAGNGTQQSISFSFSEFTGVRYGWWFGKHWNADYWGFINFYGNAILSQQALCHVSLIPLNTWHFFVARFLAGNSLSNGFIQCYMDGKLLIEESNVLMLPVASSPANRDTYIGAANGMPPTLNGYINSVIALKRCLSLIEINEYFQQTKKSFPL